MLGRSASFNRVDCYGQQGFKPIENFINCIKKSQYGIHKPPETNQEWFSSWGGCKLLQDCRFSFSRDCCNCATKTVCATNAELFYGDLQENIDFCSISLKVIDGRGKNGLFPSDNIRKEHPAHLAVPAGIHEHRPSQVQTQGQNFNL